jgi:hypothetical protein
LCVAGNRELKKIRLAGNQLTSLSQEFFSKQVFLRDLSLAANQFRDMRHNSRSTFFSVLCAFKYQILYATTFIWIKSRILLSLLIYILMNRVMQKKQ